jgi:hypothetical protein
MTSIDGYKTCDYDEHRTLAAELAGCKQQLALAPTYEKMIAHHGAQEQRIHELETIIARNDTTESFKCSECGAWHVRKVEAK